MNTFISSHALIGKVIRDFGLSRADFKDDAVEWIADAFEKIGYGVGLIDEAVERTVRDFRIKKPEYAVSISGVYYNGIRVSSKRKEGMSRQLTNENKRAIAHIEKEVLERTKAISCKESNCKPECLCSKCSYNYKHFDCDSDRERLIDQIVDLNESVNWLTDAKHTLARRRVNNKYFANDAGLCIKTNIPCDEKVFIVYKTFALDEDGYPYVWDNFKYRDFVSKHIMLMLLQSGRKHPVVTWKDAFVLEEQALKRAINERKIPTTTQLDSFVTSWHKMNGEKESKQINV